MTISRRLVSMLAVAVVLALSTPTLGSEHPQDKPIVPEGLEALDTPLLADGLQAFQDRQYRAAFKDFDQFVKLNPGDGRGYLFRGLTLNRLGTFLLALVDLLRAEELGQSFSRLDPEIAWAWFDRISTGSWNDAGDVVVQWRQDIIDYLGGLQNDTVIISHFVVISAVVGVATGSQRIISFRPANCSVTILENENGVLTLVEQGSEASTGRCQSKLT